MAEVPVSAGRLVRLAETGRRKVSLFVDGDQIEALEGDTLMVAVLASCPVLRTSEFSASRRAGFCLMGACQDCWMWTEDGGRIRPCSTPVEEGIRVRTSPVGEEQWPNLA
ncbi:(2Fe-2S)-binding protein [Novosphingobium aerophilum]|uniref:(2Fe-2S)-binding protein n=1 Tax=Novosphingobium TaxID=165696 RepID=UPI002D76A546|nr:(2Fe-2S)-binding protein [Novosphingobium sp. RL4]WRT96067.1 (2Fe-2S)-binding protein [Novosphingobium sp. RL4]